MATFAFFMGSRYYGVITAFVQHVRVHWLMLQLGISGHDWREVLGQLSRIVAAAVFSRIWVPTGNTGRANVSALQPMPIPDDLRRILAQEE